MLILIKMFHFAQHYSRDMDDYHVRINLALNFPFSSILNQNTKHFQLTCIARFPHFTEFFLSKQMLSILRIVQLFHSTVHIAGWLLDLEVWSLQVFLSSLWSSSAPHDCFYLACRMSFEEAFKLSALSLDSAINTWECEIKPQFYLWVGWGGGQLFLSSLLYDFHFWRNIYISRDTN